jgi:hypothetical protein
MSFQVTVITAIWPENHIKLNGPMVIMMLMNIALEGKGKQLDVAFC